jgi:hypothetical protein
MSACLLFFNVILKGDLDWILCSYLTINYLNKDDCMDGYRSFFERRVIKPAISEQAGLITRPLKKGTALSKILSKLIQSLF